MILVIMNDYNILRKRTKIIINNGDCVVTLRKFKQKLKELQALIEKEVRLEWQQRTALNFVVTFRKIKQNLKEIQALIEKEVRLEWRQRYALNGMLLYIISTVFVCYMSFKLKASAIEPITWNTLFWIILLFTAVNSVAKSFTQERFGRQLYYYTLASPEGIILSKIIYNILLLLILSLIGLGFYTVMLGNPIADITYYILSVFLGSIGFASTLTMIAGIASKAENASTLMAILSFPVILPMLLMLIRLSKNAMDGIARSSSNDEIMTLLAMDAIVVVLSYILFPYLWRS